MILLVLFFKREDVVNSTTKYIPGVMFDRREDVSSKTYPLNKKKIYIYIMDRIPTF